MQGMRRDATGSSLDAPVLSQTTEVKVEILQWTFGFGTILSLTPLPLIRTLIRLKALIRVFHPREQSGQD